MLRAKPMPQGSESRMFAGSSTQPGPPTTPARAATTTPPGAASRRWADREGLSTMPAAPGNGGGVPCLAGRRRPVARIAPHGPSGPVPPAAAVRWTSRLCRSCGTPCFGAPRPRGSGGPMSSFVTTGPPASPSAARRATRRRPAPLCTSGGPRRRTCAIHRPDASPEAQVFGLRSGRAVSNRIALAAKAAGLIGRFSGHSPRVGMARETWWPRGRESLPSRLPDAGPPPRCRPTTPVANWPRGERWLGSTGRTRLEGRDFL